MAVIFKIHIECDICGKKFGEDQNKMTATAQRGDARKIGWIYSGNKDRCPDCRPRTKDGQLMTHKKHVRL